MDLKAINNDLDLRRVLTSLVDTIEDRPQTTQGISPMRPFGNILGSEIKAIHDDSQSVFPESVYSNVISRRNRWKSMYTSTHHPLTERDYNKWYGENILGLTDPDKPATAPPYLTDRGERRPSTVHLKNADREKMFMNWKVPARLTDEPPSSRAGAGLTDPDFNIGREIPHPTDFKTQYGAAIPDVAMRPRTKSYTPATPRLGGAYQPSVGSMSPRLAAIGNATGPQRFSSLQAIDPIPVPPTPRACNPGVSKKQTKLPYQTKSFRTQQLFNTFKDGPTFTSLDQFMQTATEQEKDLVDKTMRLIYDKQSVGKESVRNVQKWLDTASAQERAVALNFFESIGIKMINTATVEQRENVDKIMGLLKNYKSRDIVTAQRSGTFADNAKTGPKYIRLLTPSTRANKWMHQTWHHLPVFKDDDPVNNRSAMYSDAGALPYRHWNIHPDWQLKQQQ